MFEVQHTNQLVVVIEEEKATIDAFVDVLRKEEDALVKGQIDDIDMLASGKARLAEKLENLSQLRIENLVSLGFSPDKSGMHMWLTTQATDAEKSVWQELVAQVKVAERINQSNGKIISAQLQYNQRAYMALQSAAGNVSMYGPKGQAFV